MHLPKRIFMTAIIAMAVGSASPTLAFNGQLATTSTSSTETSCKDVQTAVERPTGSSTCEVETANQRPSADFAGTSNCKPELEEVPVMMPVCTTKIYTTTTTRQKTCNSGNSSSGCNATWAVISEKTTCVTSKGAAC